MRSPLQPFTVLLVDDEEDFVRTLADRMEMRDIGSEVALTGEQALSILEVEVPDVIVLDVRMPGMGGMELLRRVKKAHPDTGVVVLTGHDSHGAEERALRLGAFAYVRKPVDIDDLIGTIKSASGEHCDG
jgi:DNA-binding NtrC family response regulator